MTSDSQIKPANKRPFLRRLTSLVTSSKSGSGQHHQRHQPETGNDATASAEHQRRIDVIIYKQRRLEEVISCVQATREILRDLRADYEALQVSSWTLSLYLSPASTAAVIETAIDRLDDYEQHQHSDRRLSSLVARRLSTLPHACNLRANYDTRSTSELDAEIKRIQERTEMLKQQLKVQRRALHVLRIEYNDAKNWLAAFRYVIFKDIIAECLGVLDIDDDDHVMSRRGSFKPPPQQQQGPGNSNKKKSLRFSHRRTV